MPARRSRDAQTEPPVLVLASANGVFGLADAVAILRRGGNALDAVEAATRVIESDVLDHSVGRGGLPNLLGQVELDASIMDGRTLHAGAVAALRGFEHPISIARKVMEELPHVLLVDRGAARFAQEMGFRPRRLLTAEARRRWQAGLDARAEGANDRARYLAALRRFARTVPEAAQGGTVNVLARDRRGNLAVAVSTSGLAWKYPGRVGDSPVIGAGNYADNRYGAAACTGRGELALRTATARSFVLYRKLGLSLEAAGHEAMADLRAARDPYGAYLNLLCLDPDGRHAGFSGQRGRTYVFQTTAMDAPAERARRVVSLRGAERLS